MIGTGTTPRASGLRRGCEVSLPGLRSPGPFTRYWTLGHGTQHDVGR